MTDLHETATHTPVALPIAARPYEIRAELGSDVATRESLLDVCFGASRHARTCQRLRDGRRPAEGLAFSVVAQGLVSRIPGSHDSQQLPERTWNSNGTPADFKCAFGGSFENSPLEPSSEREGNFRNAKRLVGTIRLWHVDAGGRAALVLGPLAVDPAVRALGVGAALMNHAIAAAKTLGHGAIILLGDAPYYARFGFSGEKTGGLALPGPFERNRLLGLELRENALDGAFGLIVPNGEAAAYPVAGEAVASARAA